MCGQFLAVTFASKEDALLESSDSLPLPECASALDETDLRCCPMGARSKNHAHMRSFREHENGSRE